MLKTIGVILVTVSAGSVGFGFAASVHRQRCQLQALIAALTDMRNEIEYRLTPLPELFLSRQLPEKEIEKLFHRCGELLSQDRMLPPSTALHAALRHTGGLQLSEDTVRTLLSLGVGLGKMDVCGQCRALELACVRLEQQLQELDQNRKARCSSYRTLGICAGLAFAVILL